MDERRQPGILIGQVFLERAQFSHREDVLGLSPTTPFEPNLSVEVQGGVGTDGRSGFVRIRVQTKPDERPLYNMDVTMMALFAVKENEENLPLTDYVRTAAPAMLYPFVREAVAGITWRGRFGPVWLAPFNIAAAMSSAQGPGGQTALPPPKRKRKGARRQPRTKNSAR